MDFTVDFSAPYGIIGELNKTYKVKKARRKPQTFSVCGLKHYVTTKISLFTVECFCHMLEEVLVNEAVMASFAQEGSSPLSTCLMLCK